MQTNGATRRRIQVPWDDETVQVEVVELRGTPPFQQVRCVVASDPTCPDVDRPLTMWLHATEVEPGLRRAVKGPAA